MPSRWEKARDLGIELNGSRTDFRVPCPACSPHRKKRKDPCLHVTVEADQIRYFCHHCSEFKGVLSDDDERRRDPRTGRGDRPQPRTRAASRWW